MKSKEKKELSKEEYDKKINRQIIQIIVLSIITILATLILINICNNNVSSSSDLKPIIYIYPEEEMKITVSLGNPEKLTTTYPKYEDGWTVVAKPDGTLIDTDTGREYYSLYWEGFDTNSGQNMQEGFVVAKEDITKFLEEKLEILGLNEREAQEFIIYWLPRLEAHEYVYIRFKTMEEIEDNMPLILSEKPDTLIRVMMEWKGLDSYKEVEEQQLEKVERTGFTVVKWGGTEIK